MPEATVLQAHRDYMDYQRTVRGFYEFRIYILSVCTLNSLFHTCIDTYIRTYVHTYIDTYIHTYIHI